MGVEESSRVAAPGMESTPAGAAELVAVGLISVGAVLGGGAVAGKTAGHAPVFEVLTHLLGVGEAAGPVVLLEGGQALGEGTDEVASLWPDLALVVHGEVLGVILHDVL